MAKHDSSERVYVERDERTFETRLQFIIAIFSNKYIIYKDFLSEKSNFKRFSKMVDN